MKKQKIGLVAGGGNLPCEFVDSAKKRGKKVVVFALVGMASEKLEAKADKIYWLNIGQYKKFAFLLLKERIRHLAMVGKVQKNVIYERKRYDKKAWLSIKKLQKNKDQKDYSILAEITRHLDKFGVEVISAADYLQHLLPEKGILTRKDPDTRIEEDIKFGYDAARSIAGMDIGQTVIVKDKTIVAVEAMEGTDVTIKRAHKVAGAGCVMVKVSRPNQDPRWDIPTVGSDTMVELSINKFSALAIESGKMFLVDKEKLIEMANSAGIVVTVL